MSDDRWHTAHVGDGQSGDDAGGETVGIADYDVIAAGVVRGDIGQGQGGQVRSTGSEGCATAVGPTGIIRGTPDSPAISQRSRARGRDGESDRSSLSRRDA